MEPYESDRLKWPEEVSVQLMAARDNYIHQLKRYIEVAELYGVAKTEDEEMLRAVEHYQVGYPILGGDS